MSAPTGWTTPAAGVITTLAACFPGFIMRYFEFIAVEGLALMPIGVILLTDFWILPRLGLRSNIAEAARLSTSWAATLTWVGTTIACLYLVFQVGMEIFFVGLPGIVIASLLYVATSLVLQRAGASKLNDAVTEGITVR